MLQWLRGLFTRSLESPGIPLSSSAAWGLLGGYRSTSGVSVNRHSALGYPALWRGINLLAHKVGRLPLQVYKRQPDGGRIVDADHPAQWLLTRRPSSLYTPFGFKSTLQAHALLHGNGYALVMRDDLARPEELLILPPESTFPVVDMASGQLYYVSRIGPNGTERKFLPENVLHIRGLSHDGIVGYSVIEILREAIGLGLAAQRYGSTWFKNNGAPGPLILKLPTYLKDRDAIKRFREQWSQLHEGIDNSSRVALLEGGLEPVPFSIDHEAAQLLGTREFEVIQIANVLGVPPHKLGAKIATSYSSLESEERSLLNDSLDGWLTCWEEECERVLLKESQAVRDSHSIEFDRRALEQADTATTTTTLLQKVNGGLMTANEARAALNLPAITDGDRMRMPANTVFLDQAGEEADAPPPTDSPGDQEQGGAEAGPESAAAAAALLEDLTAPRSARCGGKGGTPGPCPSNKPEAAKGPADRLREQWGKVLQAKAAGLPDKHREVYKQSWDHVLGNMSENGLERMGANVKKLNLYADRRSMTQALAKEHPEQTGLAKLAANGQTVGGAFDKTNGRLSMNGPYWAKEDGWVGVHHGMAHEMTHAIDGPDHEISGSPDWHKAWRAEGKGLGEYATTKPSEGLAEFGRLVMASGKSRKAIETAYPKMSQVWDANGLWKG